MTRALNCLAATAAIVAFLPTASEAALQCKSSPNAALGLTQNVAIDTWKSQVASAYGIAWSDFNKAVAKQFSESNLGVAVMHQVSARACREKPVIFQNVNPGTFKALRP